MKKISALCISNYNSKHLLDEATLRRVSWDNLKSVNNFTDYDFIVLNFSAHFELGQGNDFHNESDVFDPDFWVHFFRARGRIVCIGDPGQSAFSTRIFKVDWVQKTFDYGRLAKRPETNKIVQRYLDQVADWNSTIQTVVLNPAWFEKVKDGGLRPGLFYQAVTAFNTALAARIAFSADLERSDIFILPSSGKSVEAEDEFVLREFFGLSIALPEPKWVSKLRLPGEEKRLMELADHKSKLADMLQEITRREKEIVIEKRWFRLLYDDGHTLEDIVKEAVEFLGGKIEHASKEKEDWRLLVEGYPMGVIEIKGTHKPVFGAPALRALANWMDETIEETGSDVKGLFIGNSLRNSEPRERKNLFEGTTASLAKVRKMTILRTIDLLCFVILKMLGKLNTDDLWLKIFHCSGQFDANAYHAQLPTDFRIIKKDD